MKLDDLNTFQNKQNILLTAKHKMLISKIDAVMNQFKQLKLLKSLDIG
jgi:hypothetical protein